MDSRLRTIETMWRSQGQWWVISTCPAVFIKTIRDFEASYTCPRCTFGKGFRFNLMQSGGVNIVCHCAESFYGVDSWIEFDTLKIVGDLISNICGNTVSITLSRDVTSNAK